MAMKWLNEATLIIECGNYQLLHIDNVGSSLRRLRILLLQNYSKSGRYASKSPADCSVRVWVGSFNTPFRGY